MARLWLIGRTDILVPALYSGAFVLHMIWCYQLTLLESHSWVIVISNRLSAVYETIGFDWHGRGALAMSAGIVSSVSLNSIRRVCEGVLLGWPRYKEHNFDTFKYSWIRLIFLLFLCIVGLGVFGEKVAGDRGTVGILSVGIGTFLFGLIVNSVDDAISATYSLIPRR